MSLLQDALDSLSAQNILVGKTRNDYLLLEAERKHFEATLIMKERTIGMSHAESMSRAHATEAWFLFHKKLARKEAELKFLEFQLSILEKTWQSRYLEAKLDQSIINKQGE